MVLPCVKAKLDVFCLGENFYFLSPRSVLSFFFFFFFLSQLVVFGNILISCPNRKILSYFRNMNMRLGVPFFVLRKFLRISSLNLITPNY